MNKKLRLVTIFMMMSLLFLIPGKVKAATPVQTYAGDSKGTATLLQYTGETGYYAINNEGDSWYKFDTSSEPGYTHLYFKNTSMDNRASIEVFSFIDESLFSDYYVYRNEDATYNAKLEKGQTYYVKISGGNVGGTYKLNLYNIYDEAGNSKEEAVGISLNKEYIWSMNGNGDSDYATFTADKTGKYKFYVKNNNINHDFDFGIYDGMTDELLFNDWYIYNGETAEAVLNLEKGKTYRLYFAVNGIQFGNYSFSVNNQKVDSITLNKSVLALAQDTTYQLAATINPSNAYNTNVTWSSMDTSIVNIDTNGNLSARKPGETIITCTANDGNGAISTCNVIVKPRKVTYAYMYSSDSTSSTITVKWNGVDSPSGYTVYGYDSQSKKWNALKSVKASTYEAVINSIKVKGVTKKLSAGTSYKFQVAAYVLVDNVKYYGAKSDTITISTAPAKVTLSSATNPVSGKVKLSWKKVSGATGYYIYRKGIYDNDYYYIANVSGSTKISYIDSFYSTGKYSYKVCAYRTVDDKTYTGELGNAKTVNKTK